MSVSPFCISYKKSHIQINMNTIISYLLFQCYKLEKLNFKIHVTLNLLSLKVSLIIHNKENIFKKLTSSRVFLCLTANSRRSKASRLRERIKTFAFHCQGSHDMIKRKAQFVKAIFIWSNHFNLKLHLLHINKYIE